MICQSGPLRSRCQDGYKSGGYYQGKCLHKRHQERSWKRLREPSNHGSSHVPNEKREVWWMCTGLLGKRRQLRHQEVYKQSQPSGACLSIPAVLWQWQQPLREFRDGFQNTALGPLANYSPCSGRSLRSVLMAAQWYNNSLGQQLSSLSKLRVKVVKFGLMGHLSPNLHLKSS